MILGTWWWDLAALVMQHVVTQMSEAAPADQLPSLLPPPSPVPLAEGLDFLFCPDYSLTSATESNCTLPNYDVELCQISVYCLRWDA